MRKITDVYGTVELPDDCPWGVSTQRSLMYFSIGQEKQPEALIRALLEIKRAYALVNGQLGEIHLAQAEGIVAVCDAMLENYDASFFPLSIWQTGSGTQTNMNVNEVIARQCALLGLEVHPNDTVNHAQSSNDVYPSALHLMALQLVETALFPALDRVIDSLAKLAERYQDAIKVGRTHVQDAMPVTFGQEVSGWQEMFVQNRQMIAATLPFVRQLALGYTAVGSGANAPEGIGALVCEVLSRRLHREVHPAENGFYALSAKDAVLMLHGALNTLAANTLKFTNDLRFLSSGPRAGIHEVILPANEAGSSIMPGKVNPTQFEALAMICMRVMGNHQTVSIAASFGHLELNTMMPVIADALAQSITLLAEGLTSVTKHALNGLRFNRAQGLAAVQQSLMLAPLLNDVLGYDTVAGLVKEADAKGLSIRQVVLQHQLLTEEALDVLLDVKKAQPSEKEEIMSSMKVRRERDALGEVAVPVDALWGAQTQRALVNFQITGQRVHPLMMHAIAMVKKACALANLEDGELDLERAQAILQACDEIISGQHEDQFVTDAIQGGAGTSMNMNVNEVIANRANQLLGQAPGCYEPVHPNDHVNLSQSTNDVLPSAGKLTVLLLARQLHASMEALEAALEVQAQKHAGTLKVGKTHLQDAVLISMGQIFRSYASMIHRHRKRINQAMDAMKVLNLGGTAVGTGINASVTYRKRAIAHLCELSRIPFVEADDLVDATRHLDGFVTVSAMLKGFAVDLSKMMNDLRLMASGPTVGFREIILPEQQPGSSIMPGKVNPVIPEVVNQVCFQVFGNDLTITFAAEAGQLELNVFEPVLLKDLFASLDMLRNACETLRIRAIDGLMVNELRLREEIEHSYAPATALIKRLGYARVSALTREGLRQGKPLRTMILEDGALNATELDELLHHAI